MYILGLTSYAHEASAALIKDGEIIAVFEEERFNREKHTWKFPIHAIQACLDFAKISIHHVDHFTFFWKPEREITGNLVHVAKYFPQSLNLLKGTQGGQEELSFWQRIQAKRNIGAEIQKQFHLKEMPKVHFIEHHLAHAASCFFVSGFKESAILTLDGRGESTCTLLSVGRGNSIEKLKEIKVPHSLGHLYAAITDYLGFKPFFDEWKVMGMSAYGNDSFVKPFSDLVELLSGGAYRLNLKYFKFHTHGQSRWLSDEFYKKFGPRREKDAKYDQRHFDVAYGLQKIVEKTGVHLAQGLQRVTGQTNLCMTGGVVLNCLMNQKIVEKTAFEHFFIQPIANDAGTALGSALYYYHQTLNQPRHFQFESIYLGNEAVTHADNTARVHKVNRKVNPRYWQLISEFEKLTGVAVLLNTSFNENEPIVCTPEDAVNCFFANGV